MPPTFISEVADTCECSVSVGVSILRFLLCPPPNACLVQREQQH